MTYSYVSVVTSGNKPQTEGAIFKFNYCFIRANNEKIIYTMCPQRRIKGIAMVQWVNRLQNNIFVNPPPLPLSCEISGALHLAQPGLPAGWLAGRQTKYR